METNVKLKTIGIIKFIIRMLIGGLFLLTAILKLFSLDQFELYVYSFGIFNYLTVTVLVRLLIAFELLMGLFLIAKIYYKPVWWLTMASLAGFTLLLIYVAIFRNDTNCHCFGDFVELDPAKSIIKNVIIMILLLLIYKENDYHFKLKRWVTGGAFAVAIILPFAIFPMDAIYNQFVDPHGPINSKVFDKMLTDKTLTNMQIDSGNYAVGIFISQCKYCKLSIEKVNSIIEKHGLDKSHIKICISGNEENINKFKEETKAIDYTYNKISPIVALNITYGKFPMFILIKDGKIVNTMDLRGINENELAKFLPQKQ